LQGGREDGGLAQVIAGQAGPQRLGGEVRYSITFRTMAET
jgi:hypothetical protein